jgi:hypothetical protein
LQTRIAQEGGIKNSLPAHPEAEGFLREKANQEDIMLPALHQSEAHIAADACSAREEARHDGASVVIPEAAAPDPELDPDSSTAEGMAGLEQALAATMHVS